MKIVNLPKKYLKLWKACQPYFKECRPGDDRHALEVTKFILNYHGPLKMDLDILVPVALMHDIGHSAILPEHFKQITGPKKIANGKLVHMLTGAKIASAILKKINYPASQAKEIVEIISVHDADQLSGPNWRKMFNTRNKKIFHDIDSLDRYTRQRISDFAFIYPDRKKLLLALEKLLENFFYPEFKELARNNYQDLV